VVGPIEVYPQSRTDSRTIVGEQSPVGEAEIEVETVSIATSNTVNWEIINEISKTLWFKSRETIEQEGGLIKVWIDDWYSLITDRDYKTRYPDIVSPWGYEYHQATLY